MADEQDSIKRAQAGDDEAFATLMRAHIGSIFSFAYRYAGSREVAEDATQETFVKAWRGLGRFESAKPLRPWLLAIARNVVLDILRKRTPASFSTLESKEHALPFEETLADTEPLPDEVFASAMLGEEVKKAVAKLMPRDRAVLSLRYEEGLSFDEIGTILEAPQNTVKSWHRRALERLRSLLVPKGAPKRHE